MYLSNDLGAPTVAAPPAPADGARIKLACAAAQLAQVGSVLGRTVTADDVAALVRRAADGAFGLASAASVPVTGKQARLFEAVFGVPPAWHPPGAAWSLGGVVRKRFAMTARLLASGALRISCYGASSPRAAGDSAEYVIRATGGVYRIGLGRLFWAAVRDNDPGAFESSLLIGALRVGFGPLVSFQEGAKRKNLSYCYGRYALYSAGKPIPAMMADGCPVPPDRWDRLMPETIPAPPAAPLTPSGGPASPPGRPPVRLRLTDQELEQILGIKPDDWLEAHIEWIIRQVPPTLTAKPVGAVLKQKLREGLDQVADRLGLPVRYRKYLHRIGEGAVERGAKLVVEEGVRRIGLGADAALAVWAAVERIAKEAP